MPQAASGSHCHAGGTEDISTVEGNGFSLQVNCFLPPGRYVQYQQLNALQYVVIVALDQLFWLVQYWSQGSSSWLQVLQSGFVT